MRFCTCIAVLAPLALVACGPSTRTIEFEATDAHTGAPVRSTHIRAVALEHGMVPLPLNERALTELLSLGKTDQQGYTDASGRVRLTLLDATPHLIAAHASPLSDVDLGEGGDERGLTWWELRADMRTLEAWDDVAGIPIERRAVRLRIAP